MNITFRSIFSGERDHVELLQNLKSPKSTPFNRMKAIWKEAGPAAHADASRTMFNWHRNGQSADMACPRKGHQVIQMRDLTSLVKSSVSCLDEKLASLIPQSAGISLADVQAGIDDLTDDPSSTTSFLFSRSGSELFSPLVNKLYNALQAEFHDEDGAPNAKKIDQWFEKEQDLLGSLSFAISWNSGYPARAFQLLDTRFKCDGSRPRNIFHISGLPVLAWPKSKGLWRRGTQTSLWVLPHAMRLSLYLYIAVIRQVQLKLMKELKRDTSLHTKYLFVHNTASKSSDATWTTAHLNGTVFKPKFPGSFDFALDDRHMRQLAKSVVAQHLPNLLLSREAASTTGALSGFTKQGGHKGATQETHYGRINVPLGMSWIETENCFASSQVWQAFFGVAALDDRWRSIYVDLPVRLQMENQKTALDRARFRVAKDYGIPASNPPETVRKVSEVLNQLPFLTNFSGADSIMVSVASALIFGHGEPRSNQPIPPGGYDIEPVARAVTFIIIALQEWKTGTHEPIVELAAGNHKTIQDQVDAATELFSAWKTHSGDLWIEFSDQIRTRAFERTQSDHKFTTIAFDRCLISPLVL